MVGPLQSTVSLTCPKPCRCVYFGHKQLSVTCARKGLLEVPEGIPEEAVELYLGYNSLSHIRSNTFRKLTKLRQLSLKGNLIVTLENGAFVGLSNLTSLFLTRNRLSLINKEVFAPLVNLENIYLTDNYLASIPEVSQSVNLRKLNLDNNRLTNASFADSYSKLINLKSINLNNNPKIKVITKADFAAFEGIHVAKLSLGRCSLQDIENGTFSVFPSLVSLQLSYSKIPPANLPNVIAGLQGSHISSLDLSGVITGGMLLSNTFDALDGVPLLHLFLRHNDVGNLRPKTFQYMSSLQSLDLSYSKIDLADDGAFDGLVQLERLLLYHNRFQHFPKKLPQSCQYIDLSHNNQEESDKDLLVGVVDNMPNLEELYIHHCGLEKIANDALLGTMKLKKLDLSHNAIPNNNIGPDVFRTLVNLEELLLNNNMLKNFEKEHSIFKDLLSLKTLNMNSNNCERLPTDSFSTLSKLQELDLSGNNLGQQIAADIDGNLFTLLGELVSLDLSDNNLNVLPDKLFINLRKLKNLRLNKNEISKWDPEIFNPTISLTHLDLARNHISVVNESSLAFAERSLESLNMSQNPFSCYCSLMWFREWINKTNITLENVATYTCSSPKTMVGQKVLNFHPDSIRSKCSPPPWIIIVACSVVFVFLVTSIVGVILYRFRWRLRYKWYLHTHKKGELAGDREAIVNGQDGFAYDCFVSVSDYTEDEDWVKDVLLPRLDNGQALSTLEPAESEQARFIMCCSSVHLLPGDEPAFIQVANAIEKSRKVMIVLTKNYLRTRQMMEYELALALHKVADHGWGSVVLVIRQPGADVRLPNKMLHEVLDHGQELRWTDDPAGQQVFWNKLEDRLDKDNQATE